MESASLVGRMRGLRRDMQKKISRLKTRPGCMPPNACIIDDDKVTMVQAASASGLSTMQHIPMQHFKPSQAKILDGTLPLPG